MRAHHKAGDAHHKAGGWTRHSVTHQTQSHAAADPSAQSLLGDTAVESQRDYVVAGQAEAFRLSASASAVSGSAHVYIDSRNAAHTVIVGIYTDANDHPDSLLSTGSATSPKAGSWITVPVTPSKLTSGTTYWLAILGEGGTLRYRDRQHGPCPSVTSASSSLGAMPSIWSTETIYSDCPASAYVTAVASTPPVDPLPPVSPVEPTPPISPEVPVEPTPPAEPTPPPPPPPPRPAPPTNTALPTVSGTIIEGQRLSASAGSWSGSPASYTYQWQSCDALGEGCLDVSGATTSTHTLTSSDVGHTLRIVVTATNEGGSSAASSTATATVSAPEPEPEPVSPPTNTAMPAIRGATTEGDTLTATSGTWTGNPTSYAYQWRHCNSSGKSCANINGATTSGYTLAASDVGHTMRVMVTAANTGGQSSMSSRTTATVTAPESTPPPAPTNTALPAVSGTAIEGQTLIASKGTWTGAPTSYTYQWQDCYATGANCANIAGASASSYTLTEGDVGDTVRVVATASNAGGSASASSAASAIVTVSESTPPPAPANTALPAISGTATEGSALSTSKGTWSGSPTSYAYQWQDCNTSGASCASISGATSSSYTLSSNDVSHTIRVLVTASNAGGSMQASSAQSAIVTAHTGSQTGCFAAPGVCGYPDPSYGNVGATSPCSSLASSGEITVSTAGATVQNMNITGGVNIAAKNVTLTNDCISESGYHVVFLNGGATGFQITHSDVFGSPSVQEAINNNNDNAGALADHDYIYNCGECVHGAWTLTNSYVTTNATISGEHYEDIYCSDETFVAEHDVLVNPHEQTANLFCNADGGGGGPADNHITLTDSLLAGAGYSLYPQGNSTSVGTSTMKIVGNRFARCLTKTVFAREGDATCSGGPDANGYWPNGGYYGIDAYTYCPPTAGQEWSNNVWDDNNESVGC